MEIYTHRIHHYVTIGNHYESIIYDVYIYIYRHIIIYIYGYTMLYHVIKSKFWQFLQLNPDQVLKLCTDHRGPAFSGRVFSAVPSFLEAPIGIPKKIMIRNSKQILQRFWKRPGKRDTAPPVQPLQPLQPLPSIQHPKRCRKTKSCKSSTLLLNLSFWYQKGQNVSGDCPKFSHGFVHHF